MAARGLTPVARFSITLAAILLVTAAILGAGSAYLFGKYVEDETARFTEDAVASHFGTVFSDAIFERPLDETERKTLERSVLFHLAVYDVVATRFHAVDGRVVYAYEPSEVGRVIAKETNTGLRTALGGAPYAQRRDIVADVRFGEPDLLATAGTAQHAHAVDMSGTPYVRRVSTLETWVPVRRGAQVIGAAVVWRNVEQIDAALRGIQWTIAAIIGCAAVLLWLLLRRVYVSSSEQIFAQSRALEAALGETERTYDTTLQALSNALDVRDTETEGHSLRVVEYIELIARQLAYPADDLATLRRGALLHDIGKIGVPDHVLRKPAKLSDAEWTMMKKHPEFGARIISDIPFLGEVAEIVRHHHERYDGAGYPDALAGEAIPLGARVFSVADCLDAMTSDRPYRAAMSLIEARAEVARCRGTQFDPVVVDAFLMIPLEELAAVHARVNAAHGMHAKRPHLVTAAG